MATLFFSYSHKDEDLRDQLEVHLAMLKREGVIEAWHDRKIPVGDEFDKGIDKKLEKAEVILLLVSPDFLASPYCYEKEMHRAMQRHEQGSARVIPVILRPCDWKYAPFGKLLAAPKDGKPITKWPDRDDAFLDVVQSIRAALPAKSQEPSVSEIRTVPPAQGLTSPGPRSSNLRLKKTFTDADRDHFLDEAFDYIARFFENSLTELEERNAGVTGRFKRIDGRTFTAVIYRNGKAVSRCAIQAGASRGFGGITYSTDDSNIGHSFNERLTVESDDQSLFLQPSGAGIWRVGGQKVSDHLTFEGAAEFYWAMLIEPLQR